MNEEQIQVKLLPDEQSTHVPNKEGEDLIVPLPEHWSKADLTDVVLYGSNVSPPSSKIRAVLCHYGVKFTNVNGKKKDSEYKGLPVITINGRQINDSFIIVKTLAPILSQRLTPDLIEIERICTFGLMPALEAAVADDGKDLRKCASIMGCLGCILWTISCCLVCCGTSKVIRKEYPDLKDVEYYADVLVAKLGSNDFFHGLSAGICDVSLYGMLAPFVKAKVESAMGAKFFGRNKSLLNWLERMSKLVPMDSFLK